MGCSPGTPTKVYFRLPGETNYRVIVVENSPAQITTEQVLEPTGDHCYGFSLRIHQWNGCNPQQIITPEYGHYGPITITPAAYANNFCEKNGWGELRLTHYGQCPGSRSPVPITENIYPVNPFFQVGISWAWNTLYTDAIVQSACKFTVRDEAGAVILQHTFSEGCPQWYEKCEGCGPEALECGDCCLDCGELLGDIKGIRRQLSLLKIGVVTRQ